MDYLMNATTPGRQINFLREIEKLKGVTRTNKTLPADQRDEYLNLWGLVSKLSVESESSGLYV